MADFRVQSYESLASSNNLVKRAIEEGQPEGLVVSTYQQTAGYGRLGRSWVSPFGGLYFSIMLRPQASLSVLPTLGLLVAMTMQKVIRGFVPAEFGPRVQIKWPNDVVLVPAEDAGQDWGLRFDKLCGISYERHAGGMCVGIGVNVFHPFEQQEVGGKNIPAYVADLMQAALGQVGVSTCVSQEGLTGMQRVVVDRIRDLFLEDFGASYAIWAKDGFSPFLPDYAGNLCLTGRRIVVVNQVEEQMVAGVVEGVDDQARLLLRTDFGTVEAVMAGEVTLA